MRGRVLIAARDHHLIVHEGRIRLSRGPRTAAVTYGSRVVGVLLLGALAKDGLIRFRCKVGHALGTRSLVNGTRQEIEVSLWSAIRPLQPRATLDRNCARREHDKGRERGAARYDERAAESEGHANLLRELLLSLGEPEVFAEWRARLDSNQRPAASEAATLSN